MGPSIPLTHLLHCPSHSLRRTRCPVCAHRSPLWTPALPSSSSSVFMELTHVCLHQHWPPRPSWGTVWREIALWGDCWLGGGLEWFTKHLDCIILLLDALQVVTSEECSEVTSRPRGQFVLKFQALKTLAAGYDGPYAGQQHHLTDGDTQLCVKRVMLWMAPDQAFGAWLWWGFQRGCWWCWVGGGQEQACLQWNLQTVTFQWPDQES